MSVLRNLENKIAGLVEGAFGRAFPSEVRPVELARRLSREMDRHRQPSLSSTYVPSDYVVWLSPGDRKALAPIEAGLVEELGAYLLEHARAEHLALVSAPRIELRTDRRLALGDFGIEAKLAPVAARARATPAVAPDPAADPSPSGGAHPRAAYVSVGGQRTPIGPRGLTIGRSADVDLVLSSTDVSRRHAEIVAEDGHWIVVDLGSTNGVRVNARPIGVPTQLSDGDVIEIGPHELTFESY
jgi:hypothetical protein